MPLLDSGTTTLTGSPQAILDELGPIVFATRLHFAGAVSGDTFEIRYTVDLVEGGTSTTRSWDLVVGTTTGPDWVGDFGDEGLGWDSPVLWFETAGEFTVAQTAGTFVDMVWETHQL